MDRSKKAQADDEASAQPVTWHDMSSEIRNITVYRCCEPRCSKNFRRLCDLNKHEKTHSRSWRCPEATCKYHTIGWPSKMDLDRHFGEKHSATPPRYPCLYPPCPYVSKRESNCRQHMEKTHGWDYKRSRGVKKGNRLQQILPVSNSGLMVRDKRPFPNPPSLPETNSDTPSISPPALPHISAPGTTSIAPPTGVFMRHEDQHSGTNLEPLQNKASMQAQLRAAELEVLRQVHRTQREQIHYLQTYILIHQKLHGWDGGKAVSGQISNQDHTTKRLCTEQNRAQSNFVPLNDMRNSSTAHLITLGLDADGKPLGSCKMDKQIPEIMVIPDDIAG